MTGESCPSMLESIWSPDLVSRSSTERQARSKRQAASGKQAAADRDHQIKLGISGRGPVKRSRRQAKHRKRGQQVYQCRQTTHKQDCALRVCAHTAGELPLKMMMLPLKMMEFLLKKRVRRPLPMARVAAAAAAALKTTTKQPRQQSVSGTIVGMYYTMARSERPIDLHKKWFMKAVFALLTGRA